MKCIRHSAEANVLRVTDDEAYQKIKEGWSFCPKKLWKKKPAKKVEKVEKEKPDEVKETKKTRKSKE